jgi:hypothetical protein
MEGIMRAKGPQRDFSHKCPVNDVVVLIIAANQNRNIKVWDTDQVFLIFFYFTNICNNVELSPIVNPNRRPRLVAIGYCYETSTIVTAHSLG